MFAGLSIADAWRLKNPDGPVLFIGARGRIEERLVPAHGVELELINIGGLNRVGVLKKLVTLIQIPISFFRALQLMVRFEPDCVVGVGGFASGPVLLAAMYFGFVHKIRLGFLEPNGYPGLTNRLSYAFWNYGFRFFSKLHVFSSYPEVSRFFKNAIVLNTGNPIRSSLTPLPSRTDGKNLLIFGGSQGAVGMNSMILEAIRHLREWISAKGIEITHQTGEADYARVKSFYETIGVNARVEKFIDHMKAEYVRASVIVCRAGATTLSEIAAVRRAAILIPLPTSSDNHQWENAQAWVKQGAAKCIAQNVVDYQPLAMELRSLIENPNEIRKLETNSAFFYKPNAAQDVVKALTSNAKE